MAMPSSQVKASRPHPQDSRGGTVRAFSPTYPGDSRGTVNFLRCRSREDESWSLDATWGHVPTGSGFRFIPLSYERKPMSLGYLLPPPDQYRCLVCSSKHDGAFRSN